MYVILNPSGAYLSDGTRRQLKWSADCSAHDLIEAIHDQGFRFKQNTRVNVSHAVKCALEAVSYLKADISFEVEAKP